MKSKVKKLEVGSNGSYARSRRRVRSLFNGLRDDARAQRAYNKDTWDEFSCALDALVAGTRSSGTYNVQGHVCPETGRRAVTVAEAISFRLRSGIYVFAYIDPRTSGNEYPWRRVSSFSVPLHVHGSIVMTFDDGNYNVVGLDKTVYIQDML